MEPVLNIKNLSMRIRNAEVLSGVDLSLYPGETLGLVGRSGSGKSMTAYAAMGLAPHGAETRGEVLLDGENLLEKSDRAMNAVRGARIAMVFQEPMTALNPLQTIGAQVGETIFTHSGLSKTDAREKAAALLARVGLAPEEIPPKRYPHELSGGQRQRVVIAIAIAMKPAVLIADEPTTALDVTTQADILALLRRLVKEDGMALLLITHNLAAIAESADRIAVMKDGRIIQTTAMAAFFRTAKGGAAELLPRAVKTTPERNPDGPGAIILHAQRIACDYASPKQTMFSRTQAHRAVDGVSLALRKGEHLGLVGESGCGKSTLARALLGLHPLAGGRIMIDGTPFPQADKKEMRRLRRKIQIVFQDPYASFNPRQRVGEIIAEPFHLYDAPPDKADIARRVSEVLDAVGLSPNDAARRPHAFSGGQRQRIAIARALITEPQIIVLDEATAALDTASRTRVLELLLRIGETRGVSYLFITHDLSVVRDVASRVMVMKAGRIIEENKTDQLFAAPQDPYTKRLIAAAPDLGALLSQKASSP